MLISALILLLTFIGPQRVQAENIPSEADLVIIYGDADNDVQLSYNYLFTVAGDNAIYTCDTNQCNIAQWSNQAAITITIYKMPEGFGRTAKIMDANKLKDYVAAAESSYVLKDVSPNSAVLSEGRAYLTVYLQTDGSYIIENNNYVKPDVKDARTKQADLSDNINLSWIFIISSLVAVIALGSGCYFLWKHFIKAVRSK